MKKTIVIGASNNPERYSYKAFNLLMEHNYDVVPVGTKKGNINGVEIKNLLEKPKVNNVHTVTLYVNPQRQVEWYDYILQDLKPKRIIFNPGTENEELKQKARQKGIETLYACTLVLLNTKQF